ncbi:MAG: cysteine desulfurase NifS [Lachnospiraceae bacterium]|nr:cysteine desulfurase NifS [Lachnospiraceae bacterium]
MIYLDHGATTPVDEAVLQEMLPYFTKEYGNASTIYSLGQSAKKAIHTARKNLAEMIGSEINEIYFTAGGSEADNWALQASARAFREKGRHIITTRIEHHAVLNTCKALEREGYDVTYLPVDAQGVVSPTAVQQAIRPDTILVSVMAANNEIGTVEDIAAIGAICKEHRILFHTDAVQAFGKIPLNVEEMHIDLLSVSGHKIYGPKGIGFLYIRNLTGIGPLLYGGSQERNRRAGTENVPGIVGLGAAAVRAAEHMQEEAAREEALRSRLLERILKEIPDCRVNGFATIREGENGPCRSLPGTLNVSFPGIEAESALIMLDMAGICAAGGSACTTGALEPSHVLSAIGRSEGEAKGSLRFSLGKENTPEEMDRVAEELKRIVERLRSIRI